LNITTAAGMHIVYSLHPLSELQNTMFALSLLSHQLEVNTYMNTYIRNTSILPNTTRYKNKKKNNGTLLGEILERIIGKFSAF